MKKLFAVLFISIVGLILAGCGTSGAEPGPEEGSNTSGSGDENGIVAGKVVPSLIEVSPLEFEYQVANQTEEEVKLEFSSSQRMDYAVETKEGEELFLFSSTASFMQVMGEETIKQGEALQYPIELQELNLEPGSYVLTAWMTPTDGEMYEVGLEFTVE